MAGRDTAGISERRAGRIARQLAYHRRRLSWMLERIARNEEALESYLTVSGEDAAVLPGGFRVRLASAESGTVEVDAPPRGEDPRQPRLVEVPVRGGR